ncbi:flavin reductase family protein [Maricurvus nonylphenolicus]|uniref:flavin reductase family protein n=1 Tax=Maricurvus nonylphenolicus TaxID=1008307 RepID=UPI0036F3D6A3
MTQIDSREFRNALGQFATGVTIVTTKDFQGQAVGMTANSFSSLSLEPPLVLWSIAKTSSNYTAFVETNDFAIHILNSEQQDLCGQFARKDIDRFAGVSTETNAAGTPLLTEYLARFQCTTEHRYEGGDHIILVGRVNQLDTQAGEPLLFYKGSFEQLAQTEPV